MSERVCAWCDATFAPRKNGGSPQKFCSTPCREEFHVACRVWAENQVWRGFVPVSALREARQEHARCDKAPGAQGRGVG